MDTLKQWIPLMMKNRGNDNCVAATRVKIGTDVDYGKLTRDMLDYLAMQKGVDILTHCKVMKLTKKENWLVDIITLSG